MVANDNVVAAYTRSNTARLSPPITTVPLIVADCADLIVTLGAAVRASRMLVPVTEKALEEGGTNDESTTLNHLLLHVIQLS